MCTQVPNFLLDSVLLLYEYIDVFLFHNDEAASTVTYAWTSKLVQGWLSALHTLKHKFIILPVMGVCRLNNVENVDPSWFSGNFCSSEEFSSPHWNNNRFTGNSNYDTVPIFQQNHLSWKQLGIFISLGIPVWTCWIRLLNDVQIL